MISKQYFIVVAGKPAGPYTIEEIKAKKITPETFVKCTGMDDYKEAQEVEELRYHLGFKKPYLLIQYYASFDQRLLASAIDYFIISLIVALITVTLFVIFETHNSRIYISFFSVIGIFLFKLIYSIFAESSSNQGTIGKRMLNIKVCNEYGNTLSKTESILRNILKIINILSLGIGYIISLFNPRKQCLHDKIAKTLVIKDRLN